MKNPYKKKAISKAKEITRSKGICEKCGKTVGQFHGSHILSVGAYPAMAAELDNILCLCASCHNFAAHSWHKDPLENHDWFESMWPGRKQRLYDEGNKRIKVDWEAKYRELNERA